MALTDTESAFVQLIIGHLPETGCYVYHIADCEDPRDARDYFNSYEIGSHIGITTVYRKYQSLNPKLFIIIFTPTVEDVPTIPEEMTKLIAGLGE
jgi:hypothetical protein